MPRKIEISHKTIIFTFTLLAGIWFLIQIKDIVLILFVAFLISVTLNPIVKKLSKFKIPRPLSVLVLYLLFFAALIISFGTIVPALAEQTSNFIAGIPSFVTNLHISPAVSDQISKQLLVVIGDLPSRLVDFGVGLIANIVILFTTLTFAFYLLIAREKLDEQLSVLIGEEKADEINKFLDALEMKLGGWARGQILLMLTVGIFSYLGLTILGIPYALPLGIFAGLIEIIPYLGPILGAIPAVAIGFGISPILGLGTIAMAFLIHQVENYVLAPKIMEKSVGVPPIITLVALAVGLKLAGVVGILISIPIVITLEVLIKRRSLV